MSNIPSKGDLDRERREAEEARRKANVPNEVTSFTDQIVAAMRKRETYISVATMMPSAEAQRQLTENFRAQGWTLTFRPARTGGSISWS